MTTKWGCEFDLQNAKMLQLHMCLPRLGKRIYREIELGLLSIIQIVPRTQAIIKKCSFFLRKNDESLPKIFEFMKVCEQRRVFRVSEYSDSE